MSAEKVARLLADFDRQDAPKIRSRVVPFDQALHSSGKPPPPKPAPPPDDDAYQRGYADGQAAALADYEQKLNDERIRFNAQLDEERQNLLNEGAAKIAADVLQIGGRFEANVASVTARLLEPLIMTQIQREAVRDFVGRLSSIVSDNYRPAIRITGPSNLIDLVRRELGVRAASIELRAEPVAEVAVAIDQIVLETQLRIWADRLKVAFLD
ncbi:hypothetical protein ACTZWT_17815 [Rhodopseudomonas sp. NSM]|uniref:hypothetical protein n=1 Tax=Rhodopseudomonas sp. NSM TaxID=3457630 RepID=UPI00403594EE